MDRKTECTCGNSKLEAIAYGQIFLRFVLRLILSLICIVFIVQSVQEADLAYGIFFTVILAVMLILDTLSNQKNRGKLIKAGHSKSCARKYALAKTFQAYHT
jgi:K+ transporter